MIYYFPKSNTNPDRDVRKLIKGRDDGLKGLACHSLYPLCDESELHKLQYTYWILPWNPMGSSRLLSKLLNWAFNRNKFI